MKRCPTCNKTYSDDSMSFCLEDGAPLLTVGGDAPPAGSGSFDPNLTIPFTPPRDTAGQGAPGASGSQWGSQSGGPASGQFGQPSGYGQQGSQTGQQGSQYGGPASGQFPPPPQQPGQHTSAPGWGGPQPPPPYPSAPKKSSALPWVLGGLGLLVVLGIGAAVLIGVLASMGSNTNKNNSNNSNQVANRTNRNGSANNSNKSNSSNANNANSTTPGKPAATDDFSSEAWWTGTAEVGSAEYQNGEYHLRATSTGYMVIYGPDVFRTENATTRVTARSVSSSPEGGYGLAVFGEMSKKKELEDYCFLIRTSGTPAYKIVMHRGGKETIVVDWTDASQLRTGTSPNQLEVRTSGTQAAFYINGQYVTTIEAAAGYAVGLAGFYTSGSEEVAFDDLQIFK